MKNVDEGEQSVNKNLDKTMVGIADLKSNQKGSMLGSMLFGGLLYSLVFIAVGALILITLARKLWNSLVEQYYPDPTPEDEQTHLVVFGIEIPFVQEIMDFGKFIWNLLTVGIPDAWDTLTLWYYQIKNFLFGRKGYFKDMVAIRHTARRIVDAFILGLKKKAFGWLWDILCTVVSFIPGVGPFVVFLMRLVPAIITFIENQINAAWAKKQQEVDEAEARHKQMIENTPQTMDEKLKNVSSSVKLPIDYRWMPGLVAKAKPNYGFVKAEEGQLARDKNADEKEKRKMFRVNENIDNMYFHQKSGGQISPVYIKSLKPKRDGSSIEEAFYQVEQAYLRNDSFNYFKEHQKGITLQINALNEYMKELQARIKERDTKLSSKYVFLHTKKKWNPAFAVTVEMLRSKLNPQPFGDMFSEPKEQFGEIQTHPKQFGVAPFEWLMNGIPVHIDPLQYEWWRAWAQMKLWNDLY